MHTRLRAPARLLLALLAAVSLVGCGAEQDPAPEPTNLYRTFISEQAAEMGYLQQSTYTFPWRTPTSSSQKLGLCSAYIGDLDGDGQKELLTAAIPKDQQGSAQFVAAVYGLRDGQVRQIGQLCSLPTLQYGSEHKQLFIREKDGVRYLCVTSQSMQSPFLPDWGSALWVYQLKDGKLRPVRSYAFTHSEAGNRYTGEGIALFDTAAEPDTAQRYESEQAAIDGIRQDLDAYGLQDQAVAAENPDALRRFAFGDPVRKDSATQPIFALEAFFNADTAQTVSVKLKDATSLPGLLK